MDLLDIAGFRGEIVWKGPKKGPGRHVSYDAWEVKFGVVVPIILGAALHIWDLPIDKKETPRKAIPLQPDPDYKRQTLVTHWLGLGIVLASLALFIGSIPLLLNNFIVLAAVSLIGSFVTAFLVFWVTRKSKDETRHCNIRLLLGLHEWGSSDPATWADELVDLVKPATELNISSYAELADHEKKAKRWCRAIWAARFSAAIEDKSQGEALTDSILAEPTVIEQVRNVMRKTNTRDAVWGPVPSLREWITGNPQDHIIVVDG